MIWNFFKYYRMEFSVTMYSLDSLTRMIHKRKRQWNYPKSRRKIKWNILVYILWSSMYYITSCFFQKTCTNNRWNTIIFLFLLVLDYFYRKYIKYNIIPIYKLIINNGELMVNKLTNKQNSQHKFKYR